jgi:hypothetical protein
MSSAEFNYKVHNKEMLAIVKSLKEWCAEVKSISSKINIITDYKSLKYFMTTKQLTGQQARWAEALS